MSDNRRLVAWLLFAASACLALGFFLARGRTHLQTFFREADREEAVARRLAVIGRVTEGKRHFLDELVGGRLTLREAAERFRELNSFFDDGNADLLGAYPAVTGEEALWRNVLLCARSELQGRPGAAAVLARLGAEYREHFGHDPEPWLVSPPLCLRSPPG
jgi:hypothetical protein